MNSIGEVNEADKDAEVDRNRDWEVDGVRRGNRMGEGMGNSPRAGWGVRGKKIGWGGRMR